MIKSDLNIPLYIVILRSLNLFPCLLFCRKLPSKTVLISNVFFFSLKGRNGIYNIWRHTSELKAPAVQNKDDGYGGLCRNCSLKLTKDSRFIHYKQ